MEQTLRVRGYCGFRPERPRSMLATGLLVDLQEALLWREESRLEEVLVGSPTTAVASVHWPTRALTTGSASAWWPKH